MDPQPQDLKVHSIQVFERAGQVDGKTVPVKTLTFHVGTHGPFTRDFHPPETGTASAMKMHITQQVNELQELQQHQPGL